MEEFCGTETPQDALDEPTDKFVDLQRAPSIHEHEDPPSDYIPTGFIYFITRALADEKDRVDTLTLDQYLERSLSCKDSRKKKQKQQLPIVTLIKARVMRDVKVEDWLLVREIERSSNDCPASIKNKQPGI